MLSRRLIAWSLLTASMLWATPSYPASEQAYIPPVCFAEATAKEMVVEIEKCRIIYQQVLLLREANAELEKQSVYLTKIVQAKDEELIACNEALEEQKKVDPPPSLWNRILTGLGFVGVGLLIGLLL